MKQRVLRLFLIFIMIGLTAGMGCKKGEKEFDITDGSWGISLQTSTANTSWVYQFVGNKQSGSIYYRDLILGTYAVFGDTVNFTTNHSDGQSNIYVYVYNGVIIDYYKMSGTFIINPPDGSIITGTWNAER
ncbi:MAG: hypothetical protein NT166_06980 [Candidatus Aminicenantes bacterium]|nr:hypothetical protein [Candidatus Aminicenantes bacterium]